MRTLRNFIRSLADLPRGASADEISWQADASDQLALSTFARRSIGLGLDAALRAQRARGAEAAPLRTRPTTDDRPFTRA